MPAGLARNGQIWHGAFGNVWMRRTNQVPYRALARLTTSLIESDLEKPKSKKVLFEDGKKVV